MRSPPKYAVGTRVANPLEGRTGSISHFNADTRCYTLVYSDGYTEELTENEVEQFIIRSAPEPPVEEAPSHEEMDAIGALIGQQVVKTLTSYEGNETQLMGSVSSYDNATLMYRINYTNGTFEDMTAEKTKAQIGSMHETTKKRKANDLIMDPTVAAFAKKIRWKDDDDKTPVPLFQQKFPARKTAYMIVRKVLSAILIQQSVKPMRTEKQLQILQNPDFKAKRALINFVDADGLVCLQKILMQWMRSLSTHTGALLVLKVLAVLPGVTSDAVIESEIGRTLSKIVTAGHKTGSCARALGDMALWIKTRWKQSVIPKSMTANTKTMIQTQSSQVKASNAELIISHMFPPLMERRKMTKRLQAILMGEHLDASISITHASENQNPEDQEVVLPRFNSLGSEDMRKREAGRRIQVIDTLAAKINRDHADGPLPSPRSEGDEIAQMNHGNADVHPIWLKDDGEVTVGRLRIGRPSAIYYQQHVAVCKLLSTSRTEIMKNSIYKNVRVQAHDSIDQEDTITIALPLPNKLQAPVKSILKRKNETLLPLSHVRYT